MKIISWWTSELKFCKSAILKDQNRINSISEKMGNYLICSVFSIHDCSLFLWFERLWTRVDRWRFDKTYLSFIIEDQDCCTGPEGTIIYDYVWSCFVLLYCVLIASWHCIDTIAVGLLLLCTSSKMNWLQFDANPVSSSSIMNAALGDFWLKS